MSIRVFGAIRAPGSQVREMPADQPRRPGTLGTSVLVGAFRSGPLDEVVRCASLAEFSRIFGGITRESQAPLAAQHWFSMSQGAGELWCARVADGDQVSASLPVRSRAAATSVVEISAVTPAPVIATVSADNGGRRGGRRNRTTGDVTLSSAISGSTIDLAHTMVKDAWKGASISFPYDNATWVGTVESNTTAGVLTVAGGFPSGLSSGTDGRYVLWLDNVSDLTGNREGLAVEIYDAAADAERFGLGVLRDGATVRSYDGLHLDDEDGAYWKTQLSQDAINYEVQVDDAAFSGDPNAALNRPANWAGIVKPGTTVSSTIELLTVGWTRSGTGNPYIDIINDVTWGTDPKPCTVTLTFTSSTAFDVSATYADGGTARNLPSGTVGSAYAAPNAFLPGFTVRAGGTGADTDTVIVFTVQALPSGLAGRRGYLYAAAAPSQGNQRLKWRITGNTHKAVTLESSPGSDIDVAQPPTFTGSVAGTYDLSSGTKTVILNVGGRGNITLTSSLSGATTTAAALAADLNAQELSRVSSVAADKTVVFEATSDNKIKVTALQDYGSAATIVVGNGGLNSKLGFTNGNSYAGTDGQILRLQWAQELSGGVDGYASLAAADYEAALAIGPSAILSSLDSLSTGAIVAAVPGVTTASVQQALIAWAAAKNALAVCEIDDATTTEAGALAEHATNLAVGADQDYSVTFFPSYVKIRDPFAVNVARPGTYTCTATGLLLGARARQVSDANSHAIAFARLGLNPIALDLPTGDRSLDLEALNSYGLIALRKRGPQIESWGDRIAGYNGTLPFAHKRIALSHIGRVLLTETESLVFQPLSVSLFAEARRVVRDLFLPWYRAGWFDDARGSGFEDQVSIKVDSSNNTAATRAAGELHIEIAFTIRGTSERVVFTVNPGGVSADSEVA
jgi:hypothetical protein